MPDRKRVRALFAGKRPDHPVVDLGGRVASLSLPAYLALKDFLGFGDRLEDDTVTLLNTIGGDTEREDLLEFHMIYESISYEADFQLKAS